MSRLQLEELRDAVMAGLSDKLLRRGWSPVLDSDGEEEVSFARQENPELCFQVGVHSVLRSSGVILYPSLGVQHPETSQLVLRFMGLSDDPGLCSFGCALSDRVFGAGIEVAPYTRWTVSSSETLPAVIETLCRDVDSHGMPFFSEFRGLDDLILRLQEGPGDQMRNGHLAVMSALSGRDEQALNAISLYVNEARQQEGPLAEQSWRFAEAFSRHFGVGRSLVSND